MRLLFILLLGLVLALAALLLLGVGSLPSLAGRSVSASLPDTQDTLLGRAVQSLAQPHAAEHSGIVVLPDGAGAFAARALLADAAQRSLDVQYYIWHDDMSGSLLLDALRRAADRGVRVRFLLDDNNTAGMDGVLAALHAHPNIEVRLFNPFTTRRWRVVDYLLDFSRLNRRMHNKSFTADNQVTIIGGRNVGDEYFGATQGIEFVDLDVLAVGPVVRDVSSDFDRYWASDSAYPAERVLEPTPVPQDAAMQPAEVPPAYRQALEQSPFVRDLLARQLPFEWALTQLVSDDPAKALGRAADSELLWPRLQRLLRPPRHELQVISPYFVPGVRGADYFATLSRQGVRVTIMTNALEATDVAAVHAGYAPWRKPLLQAGVRLYEMKRSTTGVGGGRDHGFAGSSGSSLHAKTFAVDRSQLFIGSLNFDPRSARLNTELGFLIESPKLAASMADQLSKDAPASAYQVGLSDSGNLRWADAGNQPPRVHAQEPGANFWQRAGVWLLSHLPIDWLL